MESLRTSLASRTHFQVLGLGLEASSFRKLHCPRLEDSTIFEPLKFRWKTPETLRKSAKTFFLVSSSRDRLKKKFLKTFFAWKKILKTYSFFFFENTCVCVLGPWSRNFFVSLALASSLVSSTPPLAIRSLVISLPHRPTSLFQSSCLYETTPSTISLHCFLVLVKYSWINKPLNVRQGSYSIFVFYKYKKAAK